jgi:phosphoribosylglycinamide formyltransferase-1
MSASPLSLVVLISGRGTNLQAIIDAVAEGRVNATLRAVISNDPEAAGLDRARRAGIATRAVNHREFASRDAFDQALTREISEFTPDLIVLAGFMRILGAGFVDAHGGRMINIHPSLLPDFHGLHTHRRALEAGVAEHGATVHFVTRELDGGPAIGQARVPVLPDDDEETLAARVLEREHVLLPGVVDLIARGRVKLDDSGQVLLDGTPLDAPLSF